MARITPSSIVTVVCLSPSGSERQFGLFPLVPSVTTPAEQPVYCISAEKKWFGFFCGLSVYFKVEHLIKQADIFIGLQVGVSVLPVWRHPSGCHKPTSPELPFPPVSSEIACN